MTSSLPIKKNIFFTGFMATGKSRIGELTAVSLGRPFYDTDSWIEEKTGKKVSEIFSEEGEVRFRQLELEALQEISQQPEVVVALGGGTLAQSAAVDIVQKSGHLVCLWADEEVILERVNRKDSRPLLSGLDDYEKREKIHSLMEARRPFYELADLKVESREQIPHHILTRRIIHSLQLRESNPLVVELGERSYPIYIGDDFSDHIDSILEAAHCSGPALVLTDQNVKQSQRNFLSRVLTSLGRCRVFFFKPGEDQKNLRSVNKLLSFMLRHFYPRSSTLVALSGGVVGDMTGFVAAIYMRGVDYIQMPTTLLAMVDSSVGGKTAVNHPLGKNMVGAFYQPKAVAISLSVLVTLPANEFLAGMAEVVKYAIIWDRGFMNFLLQNSERILNRDVEVLAPMIRRCCEIKATVVGQDEREDGIRAILNYGHTFGHAFEALLGYGNILHGLAVALGMRVAARLSVLLELWESEDEKVHNQLLDAFQLPKHLPYALEGESIWAAMELDKKNESGKRNFILPKKIGQVEKISGIDKAIVLHSLQVLFPEASE